MHLYYTQFRAEFRNFWHSTSSQNQTFRTFHVHNFPLNLHSSGFSIYLKIQTICTFNEQNFPLNLRSSAYSIYLQIHTVGTFNVHNSHWIYKILDFQFLPKTRLSVIYSVLDFQFICKSRQSIHLMYRISHWIYAAQDIQFLCKSRRSVHILSTQFLAEFTKYWIFNFSTKPDIPCIYCTQFPIKFTKFRIFNLFENLDSPYI